jgi:hypothetical protein
MKVKPSTKPGHVLLDLDEAGIRLLARETLSAHAAEHPDLAALQAETQARATRLMRMNNGCAGWRNFGIND